MTTAQMILTVGAVVLGTMATRFLPFLLSPPASPPRDMCNIWAGCCPMR